MALTRTAKICEELDEVRNLRDAMIRNLKMLGGVGFIMEKRTMYKILGRQDASFNPEYWASPISFFGGSVDAKNPEVLDKMRMLAGPNGYTIYRAWIAKHGEVKDADSTSD